MRTTRTWYEVCVNAISGEGISDAAVAETLQQAHDVRTRFREQYPSAHLIIVRQHSTATEEYRVLHHLTVHQGRTAMERRVAATKEVLNGHTTH